LSLLNLWQIYKKEITAKILAKISLRRLFGLPQISQINADFYFDNQ